MNGSGGEGCVSGGPMHFKRGGLIFARRRTRRRRPQHLSKPVDERDGAGTIRRSVNTGGLQVQLALTALNCAQLPEMAK